MELQKENQTVESWMKDLSIELGVELKLDQNGICSFQIGEDTAITIEISEDFPVVNIYSPLISLPIDNADSTALLMARALELNAFQALTHGGAIATTPGGGFLIFCQSTPIEGVDSKKFSAILGSFFKTTTDLKSMLLEIPGVREKRFQPNKI
jgi:Tir chaperone protein (CesT) family